ncbi:UDP-4-amino-4-deoxy-L-arabinose--oxoglutarate aminotransferase [Streptomyces sp. enrichment culture]|uniref:DegT/DnrJ/EryC1/StrS family aminotransferase n=1 Tax=Streptomyces sp. enrichment culture TaxID=1795815 RepID=UPI003F5565AD
MGIAALLRAAGVGAGDEVVVPAFGNVEVARAVTLAGALPVFADIDPATYCLDPTAVDTALTPRTAAIVAVHRFGHPADLGQLRALGQRRGLLVLEHAELDASRDETARRERAAYLDARLRGVRTPEHDAGHTYQQYVVRVPGNGRPDRDAFARAVQAKGVACRIPVPTPVHRLPEFRRDVSLPETQRAADETLALPVDGWLTKRDMQRTASVCNALGGLLAPAL